MGAKPHRGPRSLETWILSAVFLAWIVLVITLILHHEPWRDEADTWLAARDLSFAGLLRFASYVGSPTLWYFLQVPLAKFGAPYTSLSLLNAAFAAIAVALFLWRAPFPLATRVLFAFSYFASYEYGVIARSYALAMALLFALAALHARRLERPISYGLMAALLVNTNVHGAIVGATLVTAFAWDAIRSGAGRRRLVAGATIAALGLAIAALQLVPRPDGQLTGLAEHPPWSLVTTTLAGAFFPTADDFGPARALAWILWAAALASVARSPRALFVLLGSSVVLWLLFMLKYVGNLRHWGFLLLATLVALWIARAENDATPAQPRTPGPAWERVARAVAAVGLPVALAWSTYVAFDFWRRDFRDPFSESRAMAGYLEEAGLTRVPIAAYPAPHTESLLPYLPGVRFYYLGIRAYGTHMKWDRACVAGFSLPESELLARVDQAFPPGNDVLLLLNQPLPLATAAGFRLEHTAIGNAMMGDEQYFLYRRSPR